MRRGSKTIGVIGTIIVIFTLSAFFLSDAEKTALYSWAFTFLLLAEIVLCAGLTAVKASGTNHHNIFVRSGISAALFLYTAAALIMVLFMRLFENRLHTYILFQLGIIALFAIVILLILTFSRRIADSNRQLADSRNFIETCEQRVYDLLSDDKNQEYRNHLSTLLESLKYSDKIGLSSVDDRILSQIEVLENALGNTEKNKDDVIKIFSEAATFINRRAGEIQRLKKGGF